MSFQKWPTLLISIAILLFAAIIITALLQVVPHGIDKAILEVGFASAGIVALAVLLIRWLKA